MFVSYEALHSVDILTAAVLAYKRILSQQMVFGGGLIILDNFGLKH